MTCRHEVILITFAISPFEGSESGAGWTLLRAHLKLGHKVKLITTKAELNSLDQLQDFQNLDIESIGVSELGIFRVLKDVLPFGVQLSHFIWNLQILSLVKNALKTNPNQILHYGTYAGDWNINVLHLINKDISKLWGPVGGAQTIPFKMQKYLGLKGVLENLSKNLVSTIFRAFIILRLRNSRATVLCANSATKRIYSKFVRTQLAQNIALELTQDHSVKRSSEVIFGCGRLISWKNWGLAIEAMNHVENKKLFIAGEGPDLDKLRRIVSSNSLEKKVFFLGKIDRDESLKLMNECDAFVFPSLRDSASWALAEAVTLKCRVIALDLPGIRAITDGTGIELVELHSGHLGKRMALEIMKSENTNSGSRRFDLEYLSNKIENSIIENL